MKKFTAFVFLLLLSSCSPQLSIPKNARLKSLFLSPNATKFALSYTEDGYDYANINGRVYGPYDLVWFPRFLPENSQKTLPAFVFQKGARRYLSLGRMTYGPYVSMPLSGPEISRGAKHFAFKYKIGGMDYYHYDETNFGPYLKAGGWCFSPDGSKYAFWFVRNGAFYIMDNGREKSIGEHYQAPFFNEDGRLSFVKEASGSLSLNIDGRKIGPYDFLLPPVFAGSNYAIVAENARGRYLVEPNTIMGPYTDIAGDPVLNSDSVAFLELRKKNILYVHVNKKIFGPFEQAYPPRLFGKHFCFRYVKNKKNYIRVDSRIYGPFRETADVSFLSNGTAVMATLSNGTVIMRRIGKTLP